MTLEINKKQFIFLFGLVVLMLVVAMLDPVYAQAWATKADTALQQIITGLKILVRGVALVILIWKAIEMLGGKSFREVVPWFIGASVFLASSEIVALFFG